MTAEQWIMLASKVLLAASVGALLALIVIGLLIFWYFKRSSRQNLWAKVDAELAESVRNTKFVQGIRGDKGERGEKFRRNLRRKV